MSCIQKIISDKRGVGSVALLIFVVFVLSIVIVNGIMININSRQKAQLAQAKIVGFDVVTDMCGRPYNQQIPECQISVATSCGGFFLLQSDCFDTAPVLLNASGEVLGVCVTEGEGLSQERCEKFLKPYTLRTCLMEENLCLL